MNQVRLIIILTVNFLFAFPILSESRCARVITLAPSITEVFNSIDLIDSLVGVSDFDAYPDEVKSLPKIGGLFQVSFERLVSLSPTLVVGLSEHSDILRQLKKRNVQTLDVEHRSISGILSSIKTIGELCNRKLQASQLEQKLREDLSRIKELTHGLASPKVLVVIDRDVSTEKLSSLYASGSDGFYNDIIEASGGKNVVTSKTVALPSFSLEGILAMNPDVVIEIHAGDKKNISDEKLLSAWNRHDELQAVRNRRVYLIRDDFAEIPGPRFILLLRRFASILHPETITHETSSN